MSKIKCRKKTEYRSPKPETRPSFDIRVSSFLLHLNFDIRHLPRRPRLRREHHHEPIFVWAVVAVDSLADFESEFAINRHEGQAGLRNLCCQGSANR